MSHGSKHNKRIRFPWNAFLDWIFPRTCIACGDVLPGHTEGFTCLSCRRRYILMKRPHCRGCGGPLPEKGSPDHRCAVCRANPPPLEDVRSLFRYRATGARLVQCLKYEDGRYLLPELVRLLINMEGGEELFSGKVIVPVPLHESRLRRRGYNQAEVLASAAEAAWPWVRMESLLERTRATASQTRLHRTERGRNVCGAFACSRVLGPEEPFLLVDDVLTTGATLSACADALRAAGARRISAFTLAHG